MLIACILNGLGFALLALCQPRHRERVYGRNCHAAPALTAQRAIGFLAIFLSLVASVASQGAGFGSLLWLLSMSAAAFAVACTLTWRPQWLRVVRGTKPGSPSQGP